MIRLIGPFLGAVVLALAIDVLAKATSWSLGWTYAFAGFAAAFLLIFGTPFAFGRSLRFGMVAPAPVYEQLQSAVDKFDTTQALDASLTSLWQVRGRETGKAYFSIELAEVQRAIVMAEEFSSLPSVPKTEIRWIKPPTPRPMPTLALPVEQMEQTRPRSHLAPAPA